jgi:hypothetical protein
MSDDLLSPGSTLFIPEKYFRVIYYMGNLVDSKSVHDMFREKMFVPTENRTQVIQYVVSDFSN